MKKAFSKAWKASKQPRKQRKYRANAPLHIKRKMLSVNLSKELRKNAGKRNVVVRKGDVVKIMRGKFKGKTGKITKVYTKIRKVEIEGIQVKKQEGSKVPIKLQPSNLQIIELTERNRKIVETTKNKPLENEPLKKVPKKTGVSKTEDKK